MSVTAGDTISKGRIARRLILALVLFSSLITAMTTAIQLFVEYRRGVSSIERGFSLVETGYLDGLTNSMWSFDDAQITILLSGMVKLPDMEFVSIRVDGVEKWSVGQRTSKNVLSADFPMQVKYRAEVWTIGVLTVVASLSAILDRLWQDFIVILVSNAVKTFLVVGFVFAVFHRMVTHRLGQLVNAIKGLDLESETTAGLPTRDGDAQNNPDEIDEIGIALRDMHDGLAASHQSVREQERQLRVVTDNLPGSMTHIGTDLRYQFINKGAEEWLGRPASEIIGELVPDILGAATYDQLRPHIDAVLAGKPQEFEAKVAYPDGLPREMEIAYVPHVALDGAVIGYFALALDVSERHALEERLRQSQKMEAVGQLTGGISHEFNNLLQVVSGNLELLETEGRSDEDAKKRFDAIYRNVSRGAELTDRLLSFSRRQPLAPKSVDIGAVLTEMQGMLRQTLGETIRVEVKYTGDIGTASVDPGQLENALLNLALNARDAMAGGGRIVLSADNITLDDEVASRHEGGMAGDYIVISVQDDGGGMSEEAITHAFEPFFTTKVVGKGTGLGLSMVYGFAQQSGGFAAIDSEFGSGTTIRLYLPRVKMVEAPETARSAGPVRTGPAAVSGGNTVLLVEDDADVRASLADQISGLGYHVIEASDGVEALSQFEISPRVDLLLTDVVMPGGLNGLDLARQLRELQPDLHVIYTTGYSDDIVAQSGQMEDGTSLLHKPYDGKALARALALSFGIEGP